MTQTTLVPKIISDEPLSTRQAAEELGVTHPTITGAAKQINSSREESDHIGTKQGPGKPTLYSSDERKRIAGHLNIPLATERTLDAEGTPVTPASIKIYQGNHHQTLDPIDLSGSRDLGLLLSPYTEIQSFEDPLAMAYEVLNQNEALIGAMSTDLQQRQAKINQVTQAVELVEQSNQNLRQQTLAYQIESRVQAATLNQASTQLKQKIAIQQQLGKPQGTSSGEQPG